MHPWMAALIITWLLSKMLSTSRAVEFIAASTPPLPANAELLEALQPESTAAEDSRYSTPPDEKACMHAMLASVKERKKEMAHQP